MQGGHFCNRTDRRPYQNERPSDPNADTLWEEKTDFALGKFTVAPRKMDTVFLLEK